MSSDELLGVFGEVRAALLRFLVTRGARTDEAEDILQEVHVKLWSETLGPVEQPRAYLYAMTNNQFLVHRRTASRRARREEEWVEVHSGETRELDGRPSAEAQLIAREQLGILQRVLDKLPERTRDIFRRFRIDGESQPRIAAALSISVSAVEKHLTRAYEAIAAARLRLDGDYPEPRHLKSEGGRLDS